MRILRVLLAAGLVALFALLAVLFTAALVVFTGLVGAVGQLFRGKPSPVRSHPNPPPGPPRRTEEIIDVEVTRVSDKPAGR